MTPKILKAGLLVGALAFVLVGCGQNTAPTENVPNVTFEVNQERQKSYKISDRIKDKDGDSLTLSNFTSNAPAVAWITVNSASKPTTIIINAATLAPGADNETATLSFQVSDGTATTTGMISVTVKAPDALPDPDPGSYEAPIKIIGEVDEGDDPVFTYMFSTYFAHVENVPEPPNYLRPEIVVGSSTMTSLVAPTDPVDCEGSTTGSDDCFTLDLPNGDSDRMDTPRGVTVVLKLEAGGDNSITTDNKVVYVHVTISYKS